MTAGVDRGVACVYVRHRVCACTLAAPPAAMAPERAPLAPTFRLGANAEEEEAKQTHKRRGLRAMLGLKKRTKAKGADGKENEGQAQAGGCAPWANLTATQYERFVSKQLLLVEDAASREDATNTLLAMAASLDESRLKRFVPLAKF